MSLKTQDFGQTKIEILLKEYDTLRQEILRRGDQRVQVALVAAIGVLVYHGEFAEGIGNAAFVGFSMLAGIFFALGHMIARRAGRLVQIEDQINRMAHTDLLRWETEQQGSMHNVFYKGFDRFMTYLGERGHDLATLMDDTIPDPGLRRGHSSHLRSGPDRLQR